MTQSLDHRFHAFRPDLADAGLKGQVEAARFVEGKPAQSIAAIAPLRRRPVADAPLETEVLCGERLRVFETTDEGWAWVQLDADNYVGWMPADALSETLSDPTHRVLAPRTLVFPGPDIKLPPLDALPMGVVVRVTGEAEDRNARYLLVEKAGRPGGAVVSQHLAGAGEAVADFVAVAERFVGVPYLWGGKTQLGIDCSGLVQISLSMAGIQAPRDTDVQERTLGTRLAGIEALRRGDLVFWKGHVGMMVDGNRLLHANAFHMMTAIEPIGEAIERMEMRNVPVTSVRRL